MLLRSLRILIVYAHKKSSKFNESKMIIKWQDSLCYINLQEQNATSLCVSVTPSSPIFALNHWRSISTRVTRAIGTLNNLLANDANLSNIGSSASESKSSDCLSAKILSFSLADTGHLTFDSFSKSHWLSVPEKSEAGIGFATEDRSLLLYCYRSWSAIRDKLVIRQSATPCYVSSDVQLLASWQMQRKWHINFSG